MKNRVMVLVLAGVMAVSSFTGCGKMEENEVVATVEGDEISAGLANFYARMTQAQYETWYAGYMGDNMWASEAEEGKSYEESVKSQIMEDLQDMYLLEDHMKDYEIEISEQEEKAIKKAAEEFDGANGLEEKEKISGSIDTVERLLTLMTIRQKVGEAIRETADMEVSDEEAAQKAMKYVAFSYMKTDEEGNSVPMTDDEKADLKKDAEKFAKGAEDEDDFAAYATEKGYEAKDATFDAEEAMSIPAELAAAADKLEEGGVTEAVENDNGLYVAKVTSLFDKDATEAEKQNIISQRKQEKYEEVIESWRKDAKITVEDKVWKKIDFNELSVTMYVDDSDPYADEVKTDDQAEEDEDTEDEDDKKDTEEDETEDAGEAES
ncbi:MAG: peptidyl-prolyl cis-trans isomerase [Dorea sp.]|nr:peptidyl-prolyl cis-trans isomerase [Dorea sp.]